MPPPFSKGRGGFNRGLSRSISPSPNRQKRSWLQATDSGRPRQRSPPPAFGNMSPTFRNRSPTFRNRSRSPAFRNRSPAFGNRSNKDPRSSGYGEFSARSRSRSPRHQRRSKWQSPGEGSHSQQHARSGRSGEFRGRPRSKPSHRSRSPSPLPLRKSQDNQRSQVHKGRKVASPDDRFLGPSAKKKLRQSPPVFRKRSASRSPNLSFSVKNSRDCDGKPSSRPAKKEDAVPTRKVSSSTKKKAVKISLHRRFTMDDQPPFQLNMKDNVTIAVLRNPSAKPSEDVTVERVFDATLFKMVHRKHEGRRPIFDREEIKVWRHDENLTDDPDFERRLIRVKKAPHKVGDSLTRMSPDVLRKAFGLDISRDRSMSRSPKREQQIRLDPRPDPRYEARYQQQMKKKEEVDRRSKPVKKRAAGDDQRRHEDGKSEGREGHSSGSKRRSKEDTYDLRQTLQKRRSDREEEDDSTNVEFYKRSQNFSDDDRNVVFNRKILRPDNDNFDSRNDGKGAWEGDSRRGSFGRGGGRKSQTGPRVRDNWNPQRSGSEERERDAFWDKRNAVRNFDSRRRGRVGDSPPSNRGWRGGGGGFRGRGGREPDRDFDVDDDNDRRSPPIDGYYKYSQHDDRDISPRILRGRPGRSRQISRGFGGRGFRGNRGFRSRGHGLSSFGRGRGRGSFGSKEFHRDDRMHDISVEREWKHDMYDSLQREEEQPHSTTSTN